MTTTWTYSWATTVISHVQGSRCGKWESLQSNTHVEGGRTNANDEVIWRRVKYDNVTRHITRSPLSLFVVPSQRGRTVHPNNTQTASHVGGEGVQQHRSRYKNRKRHEMWSEIWTCSPRFSIWNFLRWWVFRFWTCEFTVTQRDKSITSVKNL